MEAVDPFVFYLAIFVLAIFVGYYVVWSVTPASTHAADGRHQRDLVGDHRRRLDRRRRRRALRRWRLGRQRRGRRWLRGLLP